MVFEHDYVKFPELTNNQLAQFGWSSPHKQIEEDFRADVVKVHDGDTCTLRAAFRDFDFPLRLLDINAPELNEGGEKARDWLKDRVEGSNVLIKMDKKQRVGKYGRLLGKIFKDGMDVGFELLTLGLAQRFGEDPLGIKPAWKIYDVNKWY